MLSSFATPQKGVGSHERCGEEAADSAGRVCNGLAEKAAPTAQNERLSHQEKVNSFPEPLLFEEVGRFLMTADQKSSLRDYF